MTSRTIATTADSSPICASPSAWTISSADRPDSIIFANTSLPMALLIVPFSIRATRPARAAAATGASSIDAPRSLRTRSSSPMTQLLAAFGWPARRATSSK
jgi:hypothetical protein